MAVSCPLCKSEQVIAGKQGFGVGKAAAGAVLTGGIGLLAGGIGANKIKITCLACGHEWKPGTPAPAARKTSRFSLGRLFLVIMVLGVAGLIAQAASRPSEPAPKAADVKPAATLPSPPPPAKPTPRRKSGH